MRDREVIRIGKNGTLERVSLRKEQRIKSLKLLFGILTAILGAFLLIYAGFIQISNMGAKITNDSMPMDPVIPFFVSGILVLAIGIKMVPASSKRNHYRK